jgi:hypothetical protein
MTQPDHETARALLSRHVPKDVLDGALCLHAQELAAVQRRDAAVWGVDTAAGQHRLAAADLIDPAQGAPAVSAVSPATDQTALRDRIAEALYLHEWPRKQVWAQALAMDRETFLAQADAVLAVLPANTDRAAVLEEAADRLGELRIAEREWLVACGLDKGEQELRRMAAESVPADTGPAGGETPDEAETLAAALDGLHTLIATSSRDWQTYRVDAWIWAVLCGWDCEQAEHDDTCTHGALEETAAMHGWNADTIAKARRYRAAVRALTEPVVEAQQPKESRP